MMAKIQDLLAVLMHLSCDRPELGKEIKALVSLIQVDNPDDVRIRAYLKQHPVLADAVRQRLGRRKIPETKIGKVFSVREPFSKEILQRIELSHLDEHYINWANAIQSVPEFTKPLPIVDSDFLARAKKCWAENVCGNEHVLRVFLRSSVEYSQRGIVRPILLTGEPGIGKTLAARQYGEILGLPCSFLSAPSASCGRNLSGAPSIYVGAGAGAVVQSMITTRIGNPVIILDEIEKTGDGYDKGPKFQDELLAAVDETNVQWLDNYLEIRVDASHVPYVMTCNSLDLISPPLLDRMQVVEMKSPTQEQLAGIVKQYVLPKILKDFPKGAVVFAERELDMLVDLLWKKGGRSCRVYQNAVEGLVSEAFLRSIETGREFRISEKEIRLAVAEACAQGMSVKIGF